MSQELLYTSAPRGLKPGSRGFCTVLCTQAMPAPLASAVESLSGYRPIYPSNDERASRNPVVYSHLKMQAAGQTWHVLSRIAEYGLDYSQRSNKLAHHVIIDKASEKLPGGPANLLSMHGFMREEWDGEPQVIALKTITREPHPPSGICQHWKNATGDAGWAGVVAESFLRDPERQVILLFEPGQQVLPLFAEVLSLLPPEKRWDATFSTYFTSLATGTTCSWRAMVKDSKEAHDSLRFVNALRVDLTSGSLGEPKGGDLVEIARSGTVAGGRPEDSKPPPIDQPTSAPFDAGRNRQDHGTRRQEVVASTVAPPQLAGGRKIGAQVKPPNRILISHQAPPDRPKFRRIKVLLPLMAVMFVFLGIAGISIFMLSGGARTNEASTEERSSEAATATVASPGKDLAAAPLLPSNSPLGAESTGASTPQPGSEAAKSKIAEPLANAGPRPEVKADSPQKKTKLVTAKLPTEKLTYESIFECSTDQVSSKPVARVFAPDWQPPIKRGRDKANDDRVLTTISVKATDDTAVAQIERHTKLNASIFRLKWLSEDNAKWLPWSRVQLFPDENKKDPIAEVRFVELPADVPIGDRCIKGGDRRWRLPSATALSSPKLPQLSLVRLTVSIEKNSYELATTENVLPLTIQLPAFDEPILNSSSSKANDSMTISLKVAVNPDPFEVQFRLTGKDERLEWMKSELDNELTSAKDEMVKKYKDVFGTPPKKDTEELELKLKPLSMMTPSIESRDILGYAETSVEARAKELTSDAAKTTNELRSRLQKLKSVCDRTAMYHNLAAALDDLKIVACHIRYALNELSNSENKMSVDVVDFDDAPSDVSKAER